MATSKSKLASTTVQDAPGFEVNCVIGVVLFGEGDVSPYEAALTLIGKHGTDGDYSFPTENGGTVHVFITTEHPSNGERS